MWHESASDTDSCPESKFFYERFVGSARRECLDHVNILSVLQMYRCLSEYCKYFNESRPHQGIEQRIPLGTRFSPEVDGERVVSIPILGGLRYKYRRAAKRIRKVARSIVVFI